MQTRIFISERTFMPVSRSKQGLSNSQSFKFSGPQLLQSLSISQSLTSLKISASWGVSAISGSQHIVYQGSTAPRLDLTSRGSQHLFLFFIKAALPHNCTQGFSPAIRLDSTNAEHRHLIHQGCTLPHLHAGF
ncbi:hypothetical protein DUNSADRAFT_11084 [Dunaliella salina]|uniref:Encoded protein n=1 Tax=Dunaliella salina TaxID=3046 RepID=A0ABQ7GE31_DUNSA|nr:hypothetical protein DUNSADRAFT_11084 [Dunaliella salina]|eukprot:KAF5832864.1 hypothetical protein DUNSADRAFT_11084 [Dunaliella salina]